MLATKTCSESVMSPGIYSRESTPSRSICRVGLLSPEEAARRASHGGGDYFVMKSFVDAILTETTPYFDVYKGLDMSIVGIQAYRSALANGAPVELPDFRDESVRVKYENDDWSPYPEDRKPGQPWPSILGEIKLSPEAVEHARKFWGIGPNDPGGQP